MPSNQVYKTPKRKCSRCLYERTDTEKCSERLWPPSGGYLCPECLVPAAIENLARSQGRLEPPETPVEPSGRTRSENVVPYLLKREKEAARKRGEPIKPSSITCPECGRTSYNKHDIEQGYCGNCEWWTSEPTLMLVPKEQRR